MVPKRFLTSMTVEIKK